MKTIGRKTRQALEYAGLAILGGNVFLLAMLTYWLLQSPEMPTINEPIEILNENKEIAIGEPIRMFLQINKPDEIKSLGTDPRIECDSGNLVTLTGNVVQLPSGYLERISENYIMPPKILVGDTCTFVWVTTFEINPLKKETARWVSEKFKVVER